MEFVDYKCLETLLNEGEEIIATEGIGSTVKTNFKKFVDYCNFIMPWETILSPSHTESILKCTKEINKLKAKLIKENQAAIDAGDALIPKEEVLVETTNVTKPHSNSRRKRRD